MQIETRRCLQSLADKFLAIVPKEDRKSFNRIGFHVEAAWWFYMDFCRPSLPALPNMNLRHFCKCILAFQPELVRPFGGMNHVERLLDNFFAYRSQIPVCGAAVFDCTQQRVLLVRGLQSSAKWSFPRGKMNAHESAAACAVREVLEETGYDIAPLLDESCKLEWIKPGQHPIRIYVVTLPKGDDLFPFAPRTKGEIGQIAWHHMESLRTRPKLYFDVGQFVRDLSLIATDVRLVQTRSRASAAPRAKKISMSELFPAETSGPFAQFSAAPPKEEDPAKYAHEMARELLLAGWTPRNLTAGPVSSEDVEEVEELKSLLLNASIPHEKDDHDDGDDDLPVKHTTSEEEGFMTGEEEALTDEMAPRLIFSDLLASVRASPAAKKATVSPELIPPSIAAEDSDDLLSVLLQRK